MHTWTFKWSDLDGDFKALRRYVGFNLTKSGRRRTRARALYAVQRWLFGFDVVLSPRSFGTDPVTLAQLLNDWKYDPSGRRARARAFDAST
jgi:hypothetical protein